MNAMETSPTSTTGTSGAAAPATEGGESKPSGGLAGAAVILTPKAVVMAKNRLVKRGTPDAALRLGVRGGGCSGFNYVIEFSDDAPRDRDRVFDFDGLKVYVDKKSLVYLAGSVLDWENTLMQQGFKFKNPQEAASCGCGHSFTVR
ncbi:MAG: iron-sulfur cluster assembly accessory protein [Myxococcales bacterium]|nr:MAG: iron-sulfur cluster assembly accessory protein [Myxococcales bacterium]